MAKETINEQLIQLHEDVVEAVRDRFKTGNPVSNDDIKTALLLLKNSNISAPVGDAIPDANRAARLASKLRFDGIKEKRGVVLPFNAAGSSDARFPQPPADSALA
jgi:hypothetical protein